MPELNLQHKKRYIATGLVLGNYWGGGKGSYKAERKTNNNLNELRKEINDSIDSGSLDSGMGYESLIGARMEIEEITEVEIEDKIFSHSEYSVEYFGKLTESDQDFLEEVSNCE
jgi:hypothetical protein